jgi:hypothetical protein
MSVNGDLYSPDLNQRYQATLNTHNRRTLSKRWPFACRGAANAFLVLIGPSMGGASPTEPVEPGGANRPHRDPMRIGADVMSFDWRDSRKTRWTRLCSDMLGGEQYVSALTALLNLDWRHSTREGEIPQEDLSNGLARHVWPLLSELQPRIVCRLGDHPSQGPSTAGVVS